MELQTQNGRHVAVIEEPAIILKLELTDEPLSAYRDLLELLFRPVPPHDADGVDPAVQAPHRATVTKNK